jgi:serine/threonine protein kinase
MWAFGVILAEMLSSCNEKSPTWSMFQTRASDNYLNVFSKIVSAIGVPPGDFSKSLDEASQTWLHQSFGASKTQKLRDFLREPLGNVPFFSGEKGKSDLDEAIDLIDSILKYDPNARLTAEQALHHPFFRDYQNGASFDPGVWGKIKSSTKLNISVGTLNADEWKEHVLEEVEDFITRFPPPSAEQNSLVP